MSKSEQLKRKKFFMVRSRKYYCVDMCRCQSERDDSPTLTQPLVPCRVISAVQGPDRGPAARQTDQRHGEGEPVSVAVKSVSLSFSWPRLSAARRKKQSWQLSWQRFVDIPIRMHVDVISWRWLPSLKLRTRRSLTKPSHWRTSSRRWGELPGPHTT